MPIYQPAAPAESLREYTKWIAKRKSNSGLTATKKIGKNHLPHKVFHVDLRDVTSGLGFTRARIVSWRYLYTDKQGHTAVEVQQTDDGTHHLHESHSGPMVDEQKALQLSLVNRKELHHMNFENAYLRVFALKICALWLRAPNREHDYFIPLPPYFYDLQAGQLYTTEKFVEIIQGAISKFRSKSTNQHDPMKGG